MMHGQKNILRVFIAKHTTLHAWYMSYYLLYSFI